MVQLAREPSRVNCMAMAWSRIVGGLGDPRHEVLLFVVGLHKASGLSFCPDNMG